MGRPMHWELSFLVHLLSLAISVNSLHGLLTMAYQNSQKGTGFHIMHRRSAEIESTDNVGGIDENFVSKPTDLHENTDNYERKNIYLSKERSNPRSAPLLVPDIDKGIVGVNGLGSSSLIDSKTLSFSEGESRYHIPNRPLVLEYPTNRPNADINKGRPRYLSRIIHSSEYILPHQVAGGKEVLYCTRLGELHYLWSEDHDCLVCVCLQDLIAACASCSGCFKVDQPSSPPLVPLPPPSSSLVPETIPSIPSLLPVPDLPDKIFPDVTCSPLPSNRPFQNPLNPCQTCICQEHINMYGKPDVQIDCHENSQCVLPPEPIPPIPEPLVPVPLPLCDKFPTDVLFPHPTNACLTCKCVVIPLSLTPVKHLSCTSNPECEPVSPIPIHVPEVMPWPQPAMESEPFPPGPLPGPSPHESCKPYTPNQPFQHPWDDCQLCVCTEGYAANQVIVEVNCFTKMSCCIEYAQSKPLALPHYSRGSASVADASTVVEAVNVDGLAPYNSELSLQFVGSQSADSNSLAYANTLQGHSKPESDAFGISNAGHNQYNAGYPVRLPNVLAQGFSNVIQGGPFAETDTLANLGQRYYVPYAQGGYAVQSSVLPLQNPYGGITAGGTLMNPGYHSNIYHSTRPLAGLVTEQLDGNANAYSTGSYRPEHKNLDTIPINRPGLYFPYQQQGQRGSILADATEQLYGKEAASAYADATVNLNQFDLYGNHINNLVGEASSNPLSGGYHRPGEGFNNALRNTQGNSISLASSAMKSADPALENSAEYNE